MKKLIKKLIPYKFREYNQVKHFPKVNCKRSGKKRVLLAIPGIVPGDAVSNEISLLFSALDKEGIVCGVFTDGSVIPTSIKAISRNVAVEWISDPGTLVIIEYSFVWWPAVWLCQNAKGSVWLRFQNLTFPELLRPWDADMAEGLSDGQKQFKSMVSRPEVKWVISGSYYTQTAWFKYIKKKKHDAIAPIFSLNKVVDTWKEPIQNNDPTFLFVGRVVPNKAHLDMIDFLHIAKKKWPRSKLEIIGSYDKKSKYGMAIQEKIKKLNLEDSVSLPGKVSDQELAEAYKNADFFLMFSKHEGFGIPILESLASGLPVIAIANTAIPEVVGPNYPLLFNPNDWSSVLAGIINYWENSEFRNNVKTQSIKRINEFISSDQKGKFISLIKDAMSKDV